MAGIIHLIAAEGQQKEKIKECVLFALHIRRRKGSDIRKAFEVCRVVSQKSVMP